MTSLKNIEQLEGETKSKFDKASDEINLMMTLKIKEKLI